jgi:hypothetical protein
MAAVAHLTPSHTLRKRAVVFGRNWLRILSSDEFQYGGLSFWGLLSQIWLVKPEGKMITFGVIGLHGRIILKRILNIGNVKVLAGFILIRIVPLSEYYFYKTSEICYQ